MQTKEEVEQHYGKGWSHQCPRCNSFNSHKYENGIIMCFDCKHKSIGEKEEGQDG